MLLRREDESICEVVTKSTDGVVTWEGLVNVMVRDTEVPRSPIFCRSPATSNRLESIAREHNRYTDRYSRCHYVQSS
jgi:hypothetical protein